MELQCLCEKVTQMCIVVAILNGVSSLVRNWREHEYDAMLLGAAEHDAVRAPEIVYSA